MSNNSEPVPERGDHSGCLALEDDERIHKTQIEAEEFKESLRDLNLANVGAFLCLWGLNDLELKCETAEPRFALALLARKVASHLRASYSLLIMGYYSEAAMLLRPAVEAMSYLVYFAENPEKVEEWVALECECAEEQKERREKAVEERKNLRTEALRTLRNYINEQSGSSIEHAAWTWLMNRLSGHAHASLTGLVDELGEQVTPWDFLKVDTDLEEALQVAGDLAAAVRLRRLLRPKRRGDRPNVIPAGEALGQEETEEVVVSFFNDRVQGVLLGDLSVYALMLSHHLTHLAERVWPSIWHAGKEVGQAYKAWHEQVVKQ